MGGDGTDGRLSSWIYAPVRHLVRLFRLTAGYRGNTYSVSVADVTRADRALVRAALDAVFRGWHVFPCAVGGKRPALRGNWQDLATASPDQVRDWWARAPYNIGVACGPSGLVVIDLDLPRDDAGDDDPDDDGALFPLSGADRLSRLAREHGERYPAGTYVVDTPSGGCHLYFSVTGERARNSAGSLAPHVDVRAGGRAAAVVARAACRGGPGRAGGARAAAAGRRPGGGPGVRDGGAAGGDV